MTTDIAIFESHRPALVALAYRMLGDVGRAEDIAQEAWLRWQGREVEVATPKAYLLKIVTRLCLNELDSARARHEESRGDRLPEPVGEADGSLGSVEIADEISMAFLVALQRLTPAERAILLLHDVFDFGYDEIADLLHKTESACRQLLHRARKNVALERDVLVTPREEHQRLLTAFLSAVRAGDVAGLTALLAADAVAIADGGADRVRVAGVRNLPRPLTGAKKIAAFFASVGRKGGASFETREYQLNGQPAIVAFRDGAAFVAILISVANGKIRHVFIQADPARLTHIGLSH